MTLKGSRNGPKRAPWPVVFNVSSSRRTLATSALLRSGAIGGLFEGTATVLRLRGAKEKVVGDMKQVLVPFQLVCNPGLPLSLSLVVRGCVFVSAVQVLVPTGRSGQSMGYTVTNTVG